MNLLWSSPFFSVFWPITVMLSFRGSQLFFSSLIILIPFQSFEDRSKNTQHNWYHHHLHFWSFFLYSRKVLVFVNLFTFFYFHSVARRDSKIHFTTFSFLLLLLLISTGSGLLTRIRQSVCIKKNPENFTSSLLRQVLVRVYTVWENDQNSISCTIPCGSPFLTIRTSSRTTFVIVCYVGLLWD